MESVDLPLIVTFLAIGVMGYCLWLVATLRSTIPGGIIGKSWNTLLWLVGLFAIGYAATPFVRNLPEDVLQLMVSAIFFFGAVYVLITVKLIHRVIRELTA